MKAAFLICVWAIGLASGSMSQKMAATSQVPIEKLIAHLGTLQETQKLSTDGRVIQVLAEVGRDSLQVESVNVYGEGPDLLTQVSVHSLSESITRKIRNLTEWKLSASNVARERIAKNRATLEKVFGADSYTSIWFQYQLGEKEAAKEKLSQLYGREFTRIMALHSILVESGYTPLTDVESILRVIAPMVDAQQLSVMKDQMRKMKVHVSNLPQSHIVT